MATSALTATSREDANAAAAKATIDLLRVADMDDDTKDASVAAVDACGRLARALAVSGAVRPRDAPAALLPATMLLLRPPNGRRRRAAIESAAGCATAAVTACGPSLARVAGVDGVSRLLGGVSLRLADTERTEEEATLALLRAARSAFTSSQSAKGADRKAWLVVWDRLDGQASDGRVLLAGLAHSTALLAKAGASREARLNAVELLDAMVAATPAKLQRDLWRCFLPGLFGPLWAAAAAPPTPTESDALRCRALTACTRLVVVVCGGDVEDAIQEARIGPTEDTGVSVAPTRIWRETTQQRLLFHVPAMLVACRRDASSKTRLACVAAAASIKDACAQFLGPCAALNDTLAALCFDEDPAVASEARRVSIETSSPEDVARAAQAAAVLACANDEAALRDALDLTSGRCVGTLANHWDGDAAFSTLEGLARVLRGTDGGVQSLDAPLGAPHGLVAHDTFEKRVVEAGRFGAAYPRPRLAHLHSTKTRNALRRCVWLVAMKAPTLSLEACLRGLTKEFGSLLADLVSSLAAAPRLQDAQSDDAPVDVTLDQKPLESNGELVALAEYAADEILASDAWRGTRVDPVLEEDSLELLRDGTALAAPTKALATTTRNEAAPELCRALAACAGLAAARGGPEALAALLRRALYPLLERLASTDPDARQAALAALVECAACTDRDDAKEALPALLAANLDYVVDAACRKLRRAATPEAAAKSASVVEVLLRHSQAEPATPLLRDVVRNALRDVDAHCVSAGATHVASAFLRLMRAMVRAVPHVKGEDRIVQEETEDWLKPLLRDFGDQPSRQAAKDDSYKRLVDELNKYGPRDPPAEDEPSAPVEKDDTGLTDEEKVFLGNRAHHASLKEMGPSDASPEETLLSDVAKRATYFVATDDLAVQTVAFGVLADACDRLRAVPDRVRPLVHAVWPSIRARLPSSADERDALYHASGFEQRCVSAALDVVAVLAFCVGDFLAFKFKDDAWPSLQLLLRPPPLEDEDSVPQREGVMVAALHCCSRLAQRRDLDDLVGPVASSMSGYALALASQGASPRICEAVIECVTALIRHDGDAVWLRVFDGSGEGPLPSCAPLPRCTSRKLDPSVRRDVLAALDRVDVELPDGKGFWL